jgi:hypothetical protein
LAQQTIRSKWRELYLDNKKARITTYDSCSSSHVNLSEIRNNYEMSVIAREQPALQWFNYYFYPINVSVDAFSGNIRILKNSLLNVFLKDIFSELFFNVFKYSDNNSPVELDITEAKISDDEYLKINMINIVDKNKQTYKWGGCLDAKNKILNLINTGDFKSRINFVICEDKKDAFETILFLKKSIFCKVEENKQNG